MALRMTFRGSPCPSMWGYISETITDVCNTLLQCKNWDYMSLYDEISDSIPDPVSLPQETPFKIARDLSVHIPENDLGKVDVYIDDNIAVVPDIKDNTKRVIRALPLAIHSLARLTDPLDDVPRLDTVSAKKLKAEGTLEEIKIVLGWIINTRSLLLSLPDDKHRKWSANINKMIASGKASHSILESTIGRLNHVGAIMPMMRYFFGRIHHALFRSSKHKWTNLRLCEISDLHLFLQMLDHAKSGMSINNGVFRKPNVIYRSDAS